MPFTFAHPAIILPLNRLSKRWVSMTGLIIGSMAPDFEYFLRMKIRSDYSHTLPGMLWFDLPLTILLAFIFHLLVRDAFIENSPRFLFSRLAGFMNFDWLKHFKANFFIVIVSCLIGAFSHIFWDSFTHEAGYFVSSFPSLKQELLLFNKKLPVYKLLQHGSTTLGFLIIGITIWKLPKFDTNKFSAYKSKFWGSVLLIALLILILKFSDKTSIPAIGNLVVTSISAIFIGLIISSFFYQKWIKGKPRN